MINIHPKDAIIGIGNNQVTVPVKLHSEGPPADLLLVDVLARKSHFHYKLPLLVLSALQVVLDNVSAVQSGVQVVILGGKRLRTLLV